MHMRVKLGVGLDAGLRTLGRVSLLHLLDLEVGIGSGL